MSEPLRVTPAELHAAANDLDDHARSFASAHESAQSNAAGANLGSGLASAALAGMLYAGRLQSGRFQLGEGDELSVIAAAVLGGTSLFGGKGTVIGTIVGALMIGMINNGLILMGLEFSQQLIAKGAIIILAVALSQKRG